MLKLTRINTPQHPVFPKLAQLYREAFPIEERRHLSQLEELVQTEDRMSFNAVECDGELAGLFIYWNMGSFYYLEYLAVFEQMRNRKMGQQVLDWIRENLHGQQILEAEPAETEIATRRIRYYERNGFTVYDKEYRQPSYTPEGKGCPLWVMCNREDPNLQQHLNLIKDVVYRRTR